MSRAVDGTTPRRVQEWLRDRLFPSWLSSVATLAILYLAWKTIPSFVDWALFHAIWSPQNAGLCRQVMGHGACWAFVADKFRFFLFGTYPYDQQWRPALVIAILVGLYALSAFQTLRRSRLVPFWLAGLSAIGVLMCGGLFGLIYVENERWGGLTLTLLLSTLGIAFAFPLSIFLALGRRSEMTLVRWLTIAYIELIRGVPLISVLFMASVMFPLFLPVGVSIDKLLRAQLAMILLMIYFYWVRCQEVSSFDNQLMIIIASTNATRSPKCSPSAVDACSVKLYRPRMSTCFSLAMVDIRW